MFVNFIWDERHWMHQHYIYADMADGGTGVKHLTSLVATLRLSFLLQFRAEEGRGYNWHFQAWNLLRYGVPRMCCWLTLSRHE
jgi:hypothetical protein